MESTHNAQANCRCSVTSGSDSTRSRRGPPDGSPAAASKSFTRVSAAARIARQLFDTDICHEPSSRILHIRSSRGDQQKIGIYGFLRFLRATHLRSTDILAGVGRPLKPSDFRPVPLRRPSCSTAFNSARVTLFPRSACISVVDVHAGQCISRTSKTFTCKVGSPKYLAFTSCL